MFLGWLVFTGFLAACIAVPLGVRAWRRRRVRIIADMANVVDE